MKYKIQALNGFKINFDQLSSIFKEKNSTDESINYDQLTELTGLNRRKIRVLFTYLSDVSFTKKITLKSTSLGKIVFQNDPFLEKEGTLWLMHFLSASNPYLLVWNRLFKKLFEMSEFQRSDLADLLIELKDSLSEATYKEHIPKEITLVLDAYVNQRFSKLGLLEIEDGTYQIQRNSHIPDLVFLAAIIRFSDIYFTGASAVDVNALCYSENSPGRIFFLDERLLRNKLEILKNKGLIGLESRADLDQVRLNSDWTFEGVMEHYYKSI